MKLSRAEETVMGIIWEGGSIYMKELINHYPEPKPATTTIATMLKRMQEKGYVAYTKVGSARKYHPLIEKETYVSEQMDGVLDKFFGSSASQFASFFTRKSNFSKEELQELRDVIDQQIDKKV